MEEDDERKQWKKTHVHCLVNGLNCVVTYLRHVELIKTRKKHIGEKPYARVFKLLKYYYT